MSLPYSIMKKIGFLFALLLTSLSLYAQKGNDSNLSQRIQAIEDRMAIKNVVDTFSTLADQKETGRQTLLFTANAIVESISQGQRGAPLTGRKQIGDAFANFLNNFETVYHINGQQTVALNGDKASATSYCLVVLISAINGKRMKTTMGVFYNDDFVRENGRWLIAKRQSNFAWREQQPLTP